MFQIDWGKNYNSHSYEKFLIDNDLTNSEELMLNEWEEHCFECAPPICYNSCSNYLKRNDGKCSLLETGITPINSKYQFRPNVFLKFRKWSKLEIINLTFLFVNPRFEKLFYKINKNIINLISLLYKLLPFLDFDRKRRLNGVYTFLKSKLFIILQSKYKSNINTLKYNYSFKFTCYSFSVPFRLIFESGTEKFYFNITTGKNNHLHDFGNLFGTNIGTSFRIFPENDFNAELIIGNCDIIRKLKIDEDLIIRPKVVVWDLDNTLWKGVLVEDGIEGIEIRKDIIDSIIKLDSLGIINSIASKNNFEDAMSVLKKYNIESYFVFPQINWNSKSENIKLIIKKINVLQDSIYFVDDNIFERDEVNSELPEIICFNENAFPSILSNKVFNFTPTKDALSRRHSYKAEEIREKEESKFGNNYDSFLKNCHLNVIIKKPSEEFEFLRIKELVSRTNQLNLSGKKMDETELNNILENDTIDQFIFSVNDKYGDYGIVGYINLIKTHNTSSNITEIQVLNMFISCRVAQKKIENTVMYSLCEYYKASEDSIINASYVKTIKNKPIFDSFLAMGFKYEQNQLYAKKLELINPTQIINVNILN